MRKLGAWSATEASVATLACGQAAASVGLAFYKKNKQIVLSGMKTPAPVLGRFPVARGGSCCKGPLATTIRSIFFQAHGARTASPPRRHSTYAAHGNPHQRRRRNLVATLLPLRDRFG